MSERVMDFNHKFATKFACDIAYARHERFPWESLGVEVNVISPYVVQLKKGGFSTNIDWVIPTGVKYHPPQTRQSVSFESSCKKGEGLTTLEGMFEVTKAVSEYYEQVLVASYTEEEVGDLHEGRR